jgi:hypothetical protein
MKTPVGPLSTGPPPSSAARRAPRPLPNRRRSSCSPSSCSHPRSCGRCRPGARSSSRSPSPTAGSVRLRSILDRLSPSCVSQERCSRRPSTMAECPWSGTPRRSRPSHASRRRRRTRSPPATRSSPCPASVCSLRGPRWLSLVPSVEAQLRVPSDVADQADAVPVAHDRLAAPRDHEPEPAPLVREQLAALQPGATGASMTSGAECSAGEVGGDGVDRGAVEAVPGVVVAPRGAGVAVPGVVLHVPQRHPGVQRHGDAGVA